MRVATCSTQKDEALLFVALRSFHPPSRAELLCFRRGLVRPREVGAYLTLQGLMIS